MNAKKEIVKVAAGLAVAMVFAGCASISEKIMENPYSIEQTAYDRQSVEDPYVKTMNGKTKVAVMSVVKKDSVAKSTLLQKADEDLAKAIGERVSKKLQASERFEIVERDNLALLDSEAKTSGSGDDEASVEASDAAIILKSKVCAFYGKTDAGAVVPVDDPMQSFKTSIEVDARLLDVATKKVYLSEVLTSERKYSKFGFYQKQLGEEADDVSSQLIKKIMDGRKPEVCVVETRAGGAVAKVDLSKWNLDLSMPGAPVVFYKHRKTADGKIKKDEIARGRVVKADEEMAWIEVKDYETAGVHAGHCVRLDVSRLKKR